MTDMTEEQWKKHDLFFCGGHDMPPTKVPRHVAMELFRYAQALRKQNEMLNHCVKREAICAACGKGVVDRDASDVAEQMAAHILVCEKHPVREILAENERLKQELVKADVAMVVARKAWMNAKQEQSDD